MGAKKTIAYNMPNACYFEDHFGNLKRESNE
jgi:hypothetical protein